MVSMFVQVLIASAIARPENADTASTLPTSSPASGENGSAFTPRQSVYLGAATFAAGALAILTATGLLRRHGFFFLGLSRATPHRTLVQAGLAILAIVPFTFAFVQAMQWWFDYVGYQHPTSHPMLEIMKNDDAIVLRSMVVFSAVVLAPLAEELLFRGHLQTGLLHLFSRGGRSCGARWLAIALTSLVFAWFHQEIWMMPPIFVLSLGLGYAYERTGNLWVSILVHASFNLANITIFLAQRPR